MHVLHLHNKLDSVVVGLISKGVPCRIGITGLALFSHRKLPEESKEYIVRFIHTKPYENILHISKINKTISSLASNVDNQIESSVQDSWKFEGWLGVIVRKMVFVPYGGGSYIETPKELSNSMKGLMNIKNEDESCFWYTLIYGLNREKIMKDPQRVTKYKQLLNSIIIPKDMTIEEPPNYHEFHKVANANSINLDISYTTTKNPTQITPFYNSKNTDLNKRTVYMLRLEDSKTQKSISFI
jgi:hypothetical protein